MTIHVLVTNEVYISGLFLHKFSSESYYGLRAKYSLGTNQVLNWYYNGHEVQPSNPNFYVISDGLNTFLGIRSKSSRLHGMYLLKIEILNIKDTYEYSGGIFLNCSQF